MVLHQFIRVKKLIVIIFEEHNISIPYKVCTIIFGKLPLYVDENVRRSHATEVWTTDWSEIAPPSVSD